jgi:hypothetical protein
MTTIQDMRRATGSNLLSPGHIMARRDGSREDTRRRDYEHPHYQSDSDSDEAEWNIADCHPEANEKNAADKRVAKDAHLKQ